MSKRFTDTDIWDEDWFLELPLEYMLFWQWIRDRCNHAGIWRPNKKKFEIIINKKVTFDRMLQLINLDKNRVELLNNGRWFLTGFITYQYGTILNEKNRVHKSIIELLQQNKIDYNSGVYGFGVKMESKRDQNEDTYRVKEKEKEKDIINSNNKYLLLGFKKKELLKKIVLPNNVNGDMEYMKIAKGMQNKFLEIKPDHKTLNNAKAETWFDEVRMLIKNDKRNIDDIRNVFAFAIKDKFWKNTISSVAGFRKNYDSIKGKMQIGKNETPTELGYSVNEK